jgi:hypothetical protein
MKARWSKWSWVVLMALLAGAGLTGCGTTDAENASARPWNAPGKDDYTGGLPSTMFQGR